MSAAELVDCGKGILLVAATCRLVEVPRSSCYERRCRRPSRRALYDAVLTAKVKAVFYAYFALHPFVNPPTPSYDPTRRPWTWHEGRWHRLQYTFLRDEYGDSMGIDTLELARFTGADEVVTLTRVARSYGPGCLWRGR